MAAQLAPLLTVELMPYFLKKPFSWAMTIGEQSVRAIMPNFISETSGPSFGETGPAVAPVDGAVAPVGGAVLESQPPSSAAPARPVTDVERNRRRLTALECFISHPRFLRRKPASLPECRLEFVFAPCRRRGETQSACHGALQEGALEIPRKGYRGVGMKG
jgi:hypothetical protein